MSRPLGGPGHLLGGLAAWALPGGPGHFLGGLGTRAWAGPGGAWLVSTGPGHFLGYLRRLLEFLYDGVLLVTGVMFSFSGSFMFLPNDAQFSSPT